MGGAMRFLALETIVVIALALVTVIVIAACAELAPDQANVGSDVKEVACPSQDENMRQLPLNAPPIPATPPSLQQMDISCVNDNTIRRFVWHDWNEFDKNTGQKSRDMFSKKEIELIWYIKITPPFPNVWPPQPQRSVTYYAYAEYQELLMHGPVLSRSAPWGKVVLKDGEAPKLKILAKSIGKVASGEGSRPLSPNQAKRLVQIREDGEKYIPIFLRWKELPPDTDPGIKTIRDYYCQWSRDNLTSQLIKSNHTEFFEWLACPQLSPSDNGVIP
jgi:hypothetical protein